MKSRELKIAFQDAALEELSAADRELCLEARRACQLSYAPYSKFYVGAAARLVQHDQVVLAANLENGAYPQCICAEAALLSTLNSQFHRLPISAIAIAVDSEFAAETGAAPCGSCRQQLFEAQNRQDPLPIRLLLVGKNDRVIHFERVSDLLPLAFVLSV